MLPLVIQAELNILMGNNSIQASSWFIAQAGMSNVPYRAEQEYSEMIDLKLKSGFIAIVFLLLLILDSREFIVCSHNLPDEILDIPRVLLVGHQFRADFHIQKLKIMKRMMRLFPPSNKKSIHEAIGTKSSPFGSHGSTSFYYAAEIKRQDFWRKDICQQNHRKEEIDLIKKVNLLPGLTEKSDQISPLLLTPSFPALRI